MPNEMRRRLRDKIQQATEDVGRAIETRNLQLFNASRDRRLLLQAQLDSLDEVTVTPSPTP